MYYLWLLLHYKAELSSCNRDWSSRLEIFTVWSFAEKFDNPWLKSQILFMYILAELVAYGNSRARDEILAAVATYAIAVAIPDP